MKTAIVTGATGFIGSWFVQELCKNNVKTTVIVRKKTSLLEEIINNPLCEVVESEINELQKSMFILEQYDVFFHLGWGGVAPEKKNDINIQIDNIKMSICALEISKELKCKKFIAAGTVAEYVFCDGIMNVKEKQTPNDMYGAAKVATHYFLEVRARQLKIPFIWMVLPSTYGERRKDNNIITYTILMLLNGKKPVYGNLSQMWDFLYVSEVVRAIRMIGEDGIPGKVYGIGSGRYRPLREYIEIIRDIINPELDLDIGILNDTSVQPFSSCVDITELTNDTGFVPNVSFESGIEKTIEAFKQKL